MATTHSRIPAAFPVQPVKPGQPAADPVTCGHCGLTWDDAIVTGITPAPSARCPFEPFHVYRNPAQPDAPPVSTQDLRDAIRLIVLAYRLAPASTPANLRRTVLGAERLIGGVR